MRCYLPSMQIHSGMGKAKKGEMGTMSDENRYTIEVRDDAVEIRGTLTIREAFDFLAFFEREGFTTLEDWGDRTTLYFRKRNLDQEITDRVNKNTLDHLHEVQHDLSLEVAKNKDLTEKLKDKDQLTRKVMEDASDKIKHLEKRLNELQNQDERYKSLLNLKNSPEAARICSIPGPDAQENPPFSPLSEGAIE